MSNSSTMFYYIIKLINPTAIEPGVMFTNLNSELGHHLNNYGTFLGDMWGFFM